MKKSRRYIRNSVLALCAVTALITIASGLYASRVNADTPPGMRKLMSLGLKVITYDEAPAEGQAVALHEVQEFSKLEVDGAFAVEIIGADRHSVSMTPATGSSFIPHAKWSKGGLLRIEGGAGAAGAVLRIETPTLESIDVQGADRLLVRGLRATTATLRMKEVGSARILEDGVGSWNINALTPVELRMGSGASPDATFRVSGPMSIGVAGKSGETTQP
jgi:hypothetical protein